MPITLVLNSGSSSIKFSLWQSEILLDGEIENIGQPTAKLQLKDATGKVILDQQPSALDLGSAFQLIAKSLQHPNTPAPTAIGHRVVCAGPTITENQRITPDLITEIEKYTSFAPLHTPSELFLMREAMKLYPDIPNFACLDSRFHRDLPQVTRHLPVPEEFTTLGLRRFGAHGLSYESIVDQLQPNVPERLIVAHLGNGASVCAIRNGQSVDTSMGLTPTGGILSGSRTGDLDPGILLFLLRHLAEQAPNTQEATNQLETIVNKKSGLAGVSNLSNDMRTLRKAIAEGNASARLAVDQFVYVLRKFIASYAAVLGGLDMLVFTGGIGEHDAATREETCINLEHLGIHLDAELNQDAKAPATISTTNSPVTIKVIPPAEDRMIVNHLTRLMS